MNDLVKILFKLSLILLILLLIGYVYKRYYYRADLQEHSKILLRN